jgi:hypothetical protein
LYKRFIVDGAIVSDTSLAHLRSVVGESASIEEVPDMSWVCIPYQEFNDFAQALESAKRAGYTLQCKDSPVDLSIGFTLEKGNVVEDHRIHIRHLKSQVDPEIRKLLGDVKLREAWIEGANRPNPSTPEDGGLGNLETTPMGTLIYTNV